MRSFVFFILLLVMCRSLTAQVNEFKNWCFCECVAGDEMINAKRLYGTLRKAHRQQARRTQQKLKFPLRVGVVQNSLTNNNVNDDHIRQAITSLNESFASTNLEFYLDRIERINSDLFIEDLSGNLYEAYNEFSSVHDLTDVISIYIFDHGHEFCEISETSISCGRKGGFSYILSNRTNNVVLSTFDINDRKIVAHEFGHFFGLFHTFEEFMFGKDDFDQDQCQVLGDCICDTPPDPGTAYEVYVNYSSCEMYDLHHDNGNAYKPLIENFMSYYKPCYLTAYKFTPGQIEVMNVAAASDMRSDFARHP